jgi:hypothetical protein
MTTPVLSGERATVAQRQAFSPQPVPWTEPVWRNAGKAVLAVCPQAKGACAKRNCALQPFCACARGDLAAARKIESRLWLALAAASALLVLTAFIYGMSH